jgi:protein-disulfide isomerase
VKDWSRILESGRTDGSPGAPVQLVEFGDLECPFCRQFNATLHAVRNRFPQEIAYTFVHFPIPGHRFALSAARASECAAAQGRFDEMVNAVYELQDSLGFRSWADFARDAGVSDIEKFQRCTQSTSVVPLVAAGQAAARQFNIQGTPTVMLNGWRYGSPPSDSELTRAISDLLAGRRPYDGFPEGKPGPVTSLRTTDPKED